MTGLSAGGVMSQGDGVLTAVVGTVALDRPKIDEFPVLRTTGGGRPYKALCNLYIDAFIL